MLSSFPTWQPPGSPGGCQSWARAGFCLDRRTAARYASSGPYAISEAGDYRSPAVFLSNRGNASALQLLRLRHQRLGVADLELAGGLDVERLDDAVLDQHRVALRAHAHAARRQVERQPGRLG